MGTALARHGMCELALNESLLLGAVRRVTLGVFFALTRRDEVIGLCSQVDKYPNLTAGCHVTS
jgi:hypothetical protein